MKKDNNSYVFVIKDNNGMYTGDITERTKEYVYSYSTRLNNGFFTYPDEKSVITQLNKCKIKTQLLEIDILFHIEQIDFIDVLDQESKLTEEKNPIKYIFFKKE